VKSGDTFCGNCGANLDFTSDDLVSSPIIQPSQYIIQNFSQPTTAYQQPSKQGIFQLLSLITGIISLAFGLLPFIIPFLAVICGLVAIILGVTSLKEKYRRTHTIIGITLGVLGITLFILGSFGYSWWSLIR
jgi:hypothetical protein